MQVKSPLNYPDCIQVPTMSDVDLLSPIRATYGTIVGDKMQSAISNIMGRIKWNKPKCWVPFTCIWNRPEIESIVVAYYRMAKSKQIPEYRDKSSNANDVINEVAKVSLRPKEQVKEVLNYLYWGSIDKNSEISQIISLPISSEFKKEEREMPDEFKKGTLEDFVSTISGAIGTSVDVVKWGLIIGAVGVGAYALVQVNTTAKLLGVKK